MVVLLPYLLIRSGGYSAAAAGAALLPLPIAMGLGSRAAGRLAERVGARLLLTSGRPIVAAGFALFLRIGAGAGRLRVVLPALAVVACGLTLSVAPLTAAVMGAVDAAHVGSASGVNNATRASPACSPPPCSASCSPATRRRRLRRPLPRRARSPARCSRSPPARRRSRSSPTRPKKISGSRDRPAPAPPAAPSGRARRRSSG